MKLCADNKFSLETVESGPHSMMALTKTGLLAGGPLFRTTAMFSATMPPEARAMSYAMS